MARSGIAALFITVVLLVGKKSIAVRSRRDAAVMAGLGLTLAVHWLLFFRSVQVSTASIAVVSVSTFPIFTALLEPCLARRLPAGRDLGLAALATFGVAVIVGLDFDSGAAAGAAWGSASAALFAVLTVTNSRMVSGYGSAVIAWFQYLIAALVLVGFFLGDLAEAGVRDWLLLVVLGVVITAIAHTLFISSMQMIRSETASLMVSLEPMYGVLLAWLILSERPGPRILAGGAIILSAVVVGSRRGTGDPVPAANRPQV